MATPAPPVSSLPPAPAVSDSKAVFNAKAYPFVDSLTQMADEMNAVSDWINANLNMVGPSTFTNINVDAPAPSEAIVNLKQAGVLNGQVLGSGGPGTDVYLRAVRDVVIQTGLNSSVRTIAVFAQNSNAGFGGAPDASCHIQTVDGIKLGNTANASPLVLDWYEEGSFTPVAAGSTTAGVGTYTSQVGTFTRIGNLVYFTLRIGWSAHTGTGNLTLTGLPFVSSASFTGAASPYFDGLTVGAGKQLAPIISGNSSTIALQACDVAGGAFAGTPMDAIVSSIRVTGFYQV